MGSLTQSYWCGRCKHVPEDDFVWFTVEDGLHNKTASKRMVGTWCANCRKRCENEGCECVVVMQHDENGCDSSVFGRYADTRSRKNQVRALTLANRVHAQITYRSEAGRGSIYRTLGDRTTG